MAEQDVTVELFHSGVWNDVTADVYTRDGITVTHGRGDEQAHAAPSSCELTLRNVDGRYNPRNPVSPLFGLIGRNTPLRVTVGADVRFAGEVSQWAPGRAVDDGDAWVKLSAGGVSRRLGQGASPLRSSAHRFIVRNNPVAYWPLDTGELGTTSRSPTGAADATLAPATDRVTALGFGIQAAEIDTFEGTSSATHTDLATTGPVVTGVIGASGRAVVAWGASISPSATGTGGGVSFAVSGATTIAATVWAELQISEGTTGPILGAAKVQYVDDLNPGENTFTLKYRRLGANNNVNFFDRTLIVIPF